MHKFFYIYLLVIGLLFFRLTNAVAGGLEINKANACIKPDLGPDRNLCGTASTLTVSNPGDFVEFDWSRLFPPLSPKPALTTYPLPITTAGTYVLRTKDINGCYDADTINITNTFSTLPNFTLKAYTVVSGVPLELKGDSTCGGLSAMLIPDLADTSHIKFQFTWNTGRASDDNAALRVRDSYNYRLTVTDAGGCSKSAEKAYRVINKPQICINVTKDGGAVNYGYDSLKTVIIAGKTGVTGNTNGIGTAALFNEPWDLVYHKNHLYVTDKNNNKVRRINLANNTVSDFIGDGTTNVLNAPTGLTVDKAGNFYIANEAGNNITKYDVLSNIAVSLAGMMNGPAGYNDGLPIGARFNAPKEIFADSLGFIYVSDYNNHSIRKIAPNGTVTTISGALPPTPTSGYINGTGNASRYSYPWGLAIDREGSIFISEWGNHTIRKLDLTYKAVRHSGQGGSSGSNNATIGVSINGSSASFNRPANLGLTMGGNVLIADAGNNNFRKVEKSAVTTTLLGIAGSAGSIDGGKSSATFNTPSGIATDGKNYYIADRVNHTIRKISRNKTVVICLADTNNVFVDGYCSYQPTSPGYSFEWTKNGAPLNNASSFTLTKTNANYSTPDVYVLKVTKKVNFGGGLSCDETSSDTLFVYFKAPPTNFKITSSKGGTGTSIVCANDSVTLFAPVKYKYYTWTSGAPLNLGGQIVAQGAKVDALKLKVVTGGPTTVKYFVLATDTVTPGCQYQADFSIFRVDPFATDILTPDTAICQGDVIRLRSNTPVSNATYTKDWNPKLDITSGATTPTAMARPMATTMYKLTVTYTLFGCKSTDSVLVTVNPKPFVTAGKDTGVCLGGDVLLRAKVITEGTAPYTYSWSTIPAGSSLAGQNNVLTGPTSGQTWQVLLRDAKNCTARDTMKYVINPIPLASSDFDETKVCPQKQVKLGATGSGGTPGYTYLWTPNVAIDNNTLRNPNVSPLVSTRYIAKVIDSQGCYDTASTLVNTVNFSINNFSPKTSAVICYGQTLQLNQGTTITVPSGTPAISWNQGPPLLSNSSILSPIAAPTDTLTPTKYIMTVTESSQGCVLKDSVSIIVSTPPRIAAGNDSSFCAGGTAYMSVKTVKGGTAPFTYTWTQPAGGGLASTSGSPVFATPTVTEGSLVYSVSVADVGGCTGNTGLVTITVNKIPALELGADILACDGETVKLDAHDASNDPAILSYTWSGGGTLGPSPYNTLDVTADGQYKVIVQNSTTLCSISDSVGVKFTIPLSGLTLELPSSVCKYDTIALKANLAIGKEPVEYIWSVKNGSTSLLDQTNNSNILRDSIILIPSVDYPDLLTVSVQAKNQCTVIPATDTQDYNYLSTPKAVITAANPNPANLYLPVVFTQASIFDNMLSWDFKDGSVPVETSNSDVSHTYTTAGDYMVLLTATNTSGCTDTASYALSVNNKFELFVPNVFSPNSNNIDNATLKVFGIGISNDDFNFAIYNRWGQLVFQTDDFDRANNLGWNGKMKSDGEDLPMGVYTCIVKGKFTDGSAFNQNKAVTLVR